MRRSAKVAAAIFRHSRSPKGEPLVDEGAVNGLRIGHFIFKADHAWWLWVTVGWQRA